MSTWWSLSGVAQMSRSANAAASTERVAGVLGDLPCPPHRDLACCGEVAEPGESVGELEGVADQEPGGVQGDPEGGAEVGGGELGHPGCAFPGERGDGFVVQVGFAPVGGVLGLWAGVQPGPRECHLELRERCCLFGAAGGADTVDHLSGGEGGCRVHERQF